MQSAAKGYGISPRGTVIQALDIVLLARLTHCVLYRIIIYQFNCTITVVCVYVCEFVCVTELRATLDISENFWNNSWNRFLDNCRAGCMLDTYISKRAAWACEGSTADRVARLGYLVGSAWLNERIKQYKWILGAFKMFFEFSLYFICLKVLYTHFLWYYNEIFYLISAKTTIKL